MAYSLEKPWKAILRINLKLEDMKGHTTLTSENESIDVTLERLIATFANSKSVDFNYDTITIKCT